MITTVVPGLNPAPWRVTSEPRCTVRTLARRGAGFEVELVELPADLPAVLAVRDVEAELVPAGAAVVGVVETVPSLPVEVIALPGPGAPACPVVVGAKVVVVTGLGVIVTGAAAVSIAVSPSTVLPAVPP